MRAASCIMEPETPVSPLARAISFARTIAPSRWLSGRAASTAIADDVRCEVSRVIMDEEG
jgi:hypothetical protein